MLTVAKLILILDSSVMWFGISNGAHGYDAIDTDGKIVELSFCLSPF